MIAATGNFSKFRYSKLDIDAHHEDYSGEVEILECVMPHPMLGDNYLVG